MIKRADLDTKIENKSGTYQLRARTAVYEGSESIPNLVVVESRHAVWSYGSIRRVNERTWLSQKTPFLEYFAFMLVYRSRDGDVGSEDGIEPHSSSNRDSEGLGQPSQILGIVLAKSSVGRNDRDGAVSNLVRFVWTRPCFG